ncbi:hypothetical protein D3C72_1325390 [compost metagenome]
MRQPRHGQVGFIGAAIVEHGGVHGLPRRHGHVVAHHVLQHGLGIGTLDDVLGERTHVEQRHRLAAGAVFRAAPRQPVLLPERVADLGRLSGRREEVWPLPAHLAAEIGAGSVQVGIERRAPERPRRIQFPVGPGHRVVQAQRFLDAVVQPALVAVEAGKAADIDRPQVHGRLARDDPFRQCHAGAAGRRDPH